MLANIEDVLSQHPLVPTHKWLKLIVVHVLKSGNDGFVRELDMKEEIWDPGGRSATARIADGVVLDQRDQH